MASTKYEALSAKYVKEAAAVALFGFTFRLFFWADHDEDGDHDLDDLWKSADTDGDGNLGSKEVLQAAVFPLGLMLASFFTTSTIVGTLAFFALEKLKRELTADFDTKRTEYEKRQTEQTKRITELLQKVEKCDSVASVDKVCLILNSLGSFGCNTILPHI